MDFPIAPKVRKLKIDPNVFSIFRICSKCKLCRSLSICLYKQWICHVFANGWDREMLMVKTMLWSVSVNAQLQLHLVHSVRYASNYLNGTSCDLKFGAHTGIETKMFCNENDIFILWIHLSSIWEICTCTCTCTST